MNRRNFLRRTGGLTLPLLGGISGLRVANSSQLETLLANSETDRVLVLIQLNGGNDGLNTLVPLDQLSNLHQVRPNVVLPEQKLIELKPGSTRAFHPRLTGFKHLFSDGKLGIVQSVGYPNQNRSHFRSTDIWSTASPSEVEYTEGWMGRYVEDENPGYPEGYPSARAPHPLAITMGNAASETCQGSVTNICQTINDPSKVTYLAPGGNTPLPDTPFGDEVNFLRVAISQTNAYGTVIRDAATSGKGNATYPGTAFAGHLKNVATMIGGGLQTKVYVVPLGGFDTHAQQVSGDNTTGTHAELLGTLADGIAAFQQDIDARGLTDRVLGMTYSEFGRQVASNGSKGTDHGDAAPLFVFGGCAGGTVLGENPTIEPEVQRGLAVPFQYDFRDVYGSILVDWFEVPNALVKDLVYKDFNYAPVAASCQSSRTMPVDYLSFVATGREDSIVLDWQTSEEVDHKGFEVERSTDGRRFEYLGWQPSSGQGQLGATYSYRDATVVSGTLYYYRLRQIDYDGTYAHSSIVAARLPGRGAGKLTVGLPYPNPAVDHTSVKVYTPVDSRVRYALIDALGRRLHQDSQTLMGSRDTVVEVRTDRLPTGTYQLHLDVGGKNVVRGLVVK